MEFQLEPTWYKPVPSILFHQLIDLKDNWSASNTMENKEIQN